MNGWSEVMVDTRVPSATFMVVGVLALLGARWALERSRRTGRRGRGSVVALSALCAASLGLSLSLLLA